MSEGKVITMDELELILEPYKDKKTLTPQESSKLIFKLIELLMINKTERKVLIEISKYMSLSTYEELITERTINHYCGYPLCSFYNSEKIKDVQLYHLVTKLKLPRSYNTKFCSRLHYQCSEFYKKQLSCEALWSRNLQQQQNNNQIILLDEVLEKKEKNDTNLNTIQEVIKLLTEMNVNDPELETDEVIEKFNSIHIKENPGFHKSDEIYN